MATLGGSRLPAVTINRLMVTSSPRCRGKTARRPSKVPNNVTPMCSRRPLAAFAHRSQQGNCLFLPISIRQNRQKPVVLPAQIEKWPHGWIFARTNRKLARTERQSARTDRIFVARREKWPHETIFVRTEGKIARTDRFR